MDIYSASVSKSEPEFLFESYVKYASGAASGSTIEEMGT